GELSRLTVPIVYNTGSYETVETVDKLAKTVDIFLPDLKFYDSALSLKYAAAPDYFAVAKAAIVRMVEIAGEAAFDSRGMMKKGVIVRHMVLPGHTKDSMAILKELAETFGDKIYISIMNQYTPMPGIGEKDPLLGRKVTRREYEKVVAYALSLNLTNVFIQEGGTVSESFIPAFDGEGVEF
ncbi:MAG: radical SAM protein, partial [Lachnospiraceae bacterium]